MHCLMDVISGILKEIRPSSAMDCIIDLGILKSTDNLAQLENDAIATELDIATSPDDIATELELALAEPSLPSSR